MCPYSPESCRIFIKDIKTTLFWLSPFIKLSLFDDIKQKGAHLEQNTYVSSFRFLCTHAPMPYKALLGIVLVKLAIIGQ